MYKVRGSYELNNADYPFEDLINYNFEFLSTDLNIQWVSLEKLKNIEGNIISCRASGGEIIGEDLNGEIILKCFGRRILQIGTVLLSQTFILLCFCSRFLLSTPLFWPGAKQGPREALAPGHGQTAPWPYGALVAVRTRFFRFQAARTVLTF